VSSFQKKLQIRNNKNLHFSCFAIVFVSFMGDTAPPPPPARGTAHGSCLDHDHESLEAAGASGGQSLEAPPLSPLTDSDTWHTCGTLVE